MYALISSSTRGGIGPTSTYISSTSSSSSHDDNRLGFCPPPPPLKACSSSGDLSGSLQPSTGTATTSAVTPPSLLPPLIDDYDSPCTPHGDDDHHHHALRNENAELRERLQLAEQILNDMQRFFGGTPQQHKRHSVGKSPVHPGRGKFENGGSPVNNSGTTASSTLAGATFVTESDPTPIKSNVCGPSFDLSKVPLHPPLYEAGQEEEKDEDPRLLGLICGPYDYVEPVKFCSPKDLLRKPFMSTISLGETTIATVDEGSVKNKQPVMIVGDLPPVHARYGGVPLPPVMLPKEVEDGCPEDTPEKPRAKHITVSPKQPSKRPPRTPLMEEEKFVPRMQRAVRGLPHEYEIMDRHNERQNLRASMEEDDNTAILRLAQEEEEDVTVYTKGTLNPRSANYKTEIVKSANIRDSFGERGMYTGSLCKRRSLPHGFGLMRYKCFNRVYEGEWWQGSWHGQGILRNGDGTVYEGEFETDQKVGMGKMSFFDGREFVGRFVDDAMREGTMVYADGATYTGRLDNDQRNGFGTYMYPEEDGDSGSAPNTICKKCLAVRYEGQWVDDTIRGRGQMDWADGSYYNGEWQNGFPHGMGKEVDANGFVRHNGLWNMGKVVRL